MSGTTPAIERAETAIFGHDDSGEDLTEDARRGITAALSDPDDPDSLARTLYILHHGVKGTTAETALYAWGNIDSDREHWRAVADGLRMMLGS